MYSLAIVRNPQHPFSTAERHHWMLRFATLFFVIIVTLSSVLAGALGR